MWMLIVIFCDAPCADNHRSATVQFAPFPSEQVCRENAQNMAVPFANTYRIAVKSWQCKPFIAGTPA
jgi:hypothetical protein